jgi:hypothetical protein
VVHEIGHFIVNEEYSIFESKVIDLVPDDNSSGRIAVDSLNSDINTYEFLSFLFAGKLAADYILGGFKKNFNRWDLVDTIYRELKACDLSAEDSYKIFSLIAEKENAYRVYEDTLFIIKKNRERIISLSEHIYGKSKIDCDSLKYIYDSL